MVPPRRNRNKRSKATVSRTTRSIAVMATKIIRNRTDNLKESSISDFIRTRSQRAIANCPILKLNDDCVREIFSFLSVVDLCAVKDTCRRFNVMADSTVQKRFQKKSELKYTLNRDTQNGFAVTLQHFGQFHECHVVIEAEPNFNAAEMWPQLRHCTAMKKLDLIGVNVRGFSKPKYRLKKMLRNLVHLRFEKCAGDDLDFARIINTCENLRCLNLFCTADGASDALITHIARQSSQIEDLFFGTMNSSSETFAENVAKLQHLQKLKMLVLFCTNKGVASGIEALTAKSIAQLHLIDVIADLDLARALGNFTDLRFCIVQPANAIGMTDALQAAFENFIWDATNKQFMKLKLFDDFN